MLGDGRVHLFDGAIGTELYSRGVFVNQCYDALVLDQPEVVAGVHRDYVAAGAEIVETNTFGANPVKLSGFGLAEQTGAINAAAARLALEAAEGRARVVGSVGPLGIRIEPFGPTSADEARRHFRRQMDALVGAGVDGLLLETFADPHEVQAALAAARSAAALADAPIPVLVQLTVGEDGRTPYGTDAVTALQRLADFGADAVGVNCSVGPAVLLDVLEEAAEVVGVPLLAQPNAGLPRTVRDRKMYLATPEYMARYARRFAEVGVRFVGGCCGTTPEHVARMSDALDGIQPRHTPPTPLLRDDEVAAAKAPVPLAERSALGRALASGEPVLTVELLPHRGWSMEGLVRDARRCRDAGVTAVTLVDAGSHRSRMSALAASAHVLREAEMEPVMHYTCRERNMMGMLSDLLGAAGSGIRNLLLVTGDLPVQGPYKDATAVFDIDAIGLTNMAARLNRGLDPGGAGIGVPTPFVVAVRANPGAVDMERELSRFRWKAEAGADLAVTQPVFDVASLTAFLDATGAHPLPVQVGLWPMTSLRNAEFLHHEVPGVQVPDAGMARMRRAHEQGGADEARREGIAIAREVRDAVAGLERVAGVHVHAPGGDVAAALAVIRS
jgi:homocysteine S-methyltransferase